MSFDKSKTFPFPHPTVTPITGRPDPLSLSILQGELYANAISVPTELGGGLYGHLALIMPHAEYITMDGAIDYVAPPHPGVQADAPPGATAVQPPTRQGVGKTHAARQRIQCTQATTT